MRNSLVNKMPQLMLYPFQRADGSISFLTSQLQLRPLTFCKEDNLFIAVGNHTCQLLNTCQCTVSFRRNSNYETDRTLQACMQGDISVEELL
jgi:hypothetical protein